MATKTTMLADFVVAQHRAEEAAKRLLAKIHDHFGYVPTEINYGHVGTATHVAELLEEIERTIGGRG